MKLAAGLRRRAASCALLLAVGAISVSPVAGAEAIALLPVQNRAGDLAAALAVESLLRDELERRGEVVSREVTRDAMRRLRVRNGDAAAPEVLRGLAAELRAGWLVSASLHDAERREVPRLAISARAYQGATGELFWAGFEGGSGLDGRKLLGLGVVTDLEALAPRVVRRLTASLDAGGQGGAAALGSVAIVPFGSGTAQRAGFSAETVTEAARAVASSRGIRTVSPNCASEMMRRKGLVRWGAVDAPTRAALRECGAELILTGAVEVYDVGGAQFEPEPRVTIAVRLLDGESGRILWTGADERTGWDRAGPFRLGRIYSRGRLTERMLDDLTKRLLRDVARAPGREGKRG